MYNYMRVPISIFRVNPESFVNVMHAVPECFVNLYMIIIFIFAIHEGFVGYLPVSISGTVQVQLACQDIFSTQFKIRYKSRISKPE